MEGVRGSIPLSSTYALYSMVSGIGPGGQAAYSLIARNLATGADMTVTNSASGAIDGRTVAWIGTDKLPRIGSLPTVPDPPRFLGNPIAPVNMARGSIWNAEFDVDKVMPSCSVQILEKKKVIQTLDCSSSAGVNGAVMVSWNLTDSKGKAVKAGTYSWALTGNDTDGALANYDGSTTPITGLVTVN